MKKITLLRINALYYAEAIVTEQSEIKFPIVGFLHQIENHANKQY
jgi:hypothetical protein